MVMDGQGFHRTKFSFVNRSLVPARLFNLFSSAGQASLLPFLPMYFRFIGLTAFQSGILGSAKSLVSFWAFPLLRVVAEKTKKRKLLLLGFLLATVISNISLGLINNTTNFRSYTCNGGQIKESDIYFNISSANGSNPSFLNASTKNTEKITTSDEVNNAPVTSFAEVQSTGNHSKLFNTEITSLKVGDAEIRGFNSTRSFPGVNGDTLTHSNSVATHLVNNSLLSFKQSVDNNITRLEVHNDWYLLYGFRMDRTFKILLTLVFFCELFSSSSRGISRSLLLDIMQHDKGSRLGSNVWASVGTMLGGGVLILAIGYHRCDFGLHNSFYLHFYIFGCFGALSFVLGAILKEHERKSILCLKFGKTFAYLCCDVNMISFLAVLLVLGMAESLMFNFMMWYLQDIGASITVMATIVVLSAFSEIPMQCLSKRMIRCFGHHWVIFLSLFSYGGRFLYFSYFKNPWLIVPIELLHGLSYTAVHSACGSYAAVVSLHGTEKTMKVIFSTVYYGFGMGLGGMAVALLYQLYGPTIVFRCAAGVCAIYALVFALLQCILVLPDGDRSHGKLMEYQQINLDGERDFALQADWLMEALREDGEDETHFTK